MQFGLERERLHSMTRLLVCWFSLSFVFRSLPEFADRDIAVYARLQVRTGLFSGRVAGA